MIIYISADDNAGGIVQQRAPEFDCRRLHDSRSSRNQYCAGFINRGILHELPSLCGLRHVGFTMRSRYGFGRPQIWPLGHYPFFRGGIYHFFHY